MIIRTPYEQIVYSQPSSCPGEWHTQTSMGLWHTNGSPNLGQKTRPYSNQKQQQKKENLQNCDTGRKKSGHQIII